MVFLHGTLCLWRIEQFWSQSSVMLAPRCYYLRFDPTSQEEEIHQRQLLLLDMEDRQCLVSSCCFIVVCTL